MTIQEHLFFYALILLFYVSEGQLSADTHSSLLQYPNLVDKRDQKQLDEPASNDNEDIVYLQNYATYALPTMEHRAGPTHSKLDVFDQDGASSEDQSSTLSQDEVKTSPQRVSRVFYFEPENS